MATLPDIPSTRRTTVGLRSPLFMYRCGMKSTTRTTPPLVWNSVSRIRVPSRYRRCTRASGLVGAICQRPFWLVPSSAAKHAPESIRGRHNQSIDPSLPTRAPVWLSLMNA